MEDIDDIACYIYWTVGAYLNNAIDKKTYMTAMARIEQVLNNRGKGIQHL